MVRIITWSQRLGQISGAQALKEARAAQAAGQTGVRNLGGGSGSSAYQAEVQASAKQAAETKARAEEESAEKKRAEEEAKKKSVEEKRLLEEIKKKSAEGKRIERAKIERFRKLELERLRREPDKKRIESEIERKRIDTARAWIVSKGGQTKVTTLKDAKTGDKIIQTVTIVDRIEKGKKIKERVFEQKNLRTGKTIVKTFRFDRRTGRTGQTGGISFKGLTKQDIDKIKETLPGNDTILYNKTTFEPLGIKSAIFNKTFQYNESGLKDYNSRLEKLLDVQQNYFALHPGAKNTIKKFLDKGLKKLDKITQKKIGKVDIFEEQYGTIQDFGLPTEKPFLKKTGTVDITVKDLVKPITGSLAFVKRQTDFVFDASSKGWDDLLFGQRGFKLRRTPVLSVVPKAISGAGRIATYFIPVVGAGVFVSDIGGSVDTVLFPSGEVNKLTNKLYSDYQKNTKLQNNQRHLNKSEFIKLNQKSIMTAVRNAALLELGAAVTFMVGGRLVLGAAKGLTRLSMNQLRTLSKYIAKQPRFKAGKIKIGKINPKRFIYNSGRNTITTIRKAKLRVQNLRAFSKISKTVNKVEKLLGVKLTRLEKKNLFNKFKLITDSAGIENRIQKDILSIIKKSKRSQKTKEFIKKIIEKSKIKKVKSKLKARIKRIKKKREFVEIIRFEKTGEASKIRFSRKEYNKLIKKQKTTKRKVKDKVETVLRINKDGSIKRITFLKKNLQQVISKAKPIKKKVTTIFKIQRDGTLKKETFIPGKKIKDQPILKDGLLGKLPKKKSSRVLKMTPLQRLKFIKRQKLVRLKLAKTKELKKGLLGAVKKKEKVSKVKLETIKKSLEKQARSNLINAKLIQNQIQLRRIVAQGLKGVSTKTLRLSRVKRKQYARLRSILGKLDQSIVIRGRIKPISQAIKNIKPEQMKEIVRQSREQINKATQRELTSGRQVLIQKMAPQREISKVISSNRFMKAFKGSTKDITGALSRLGASGIISSILALGVISKVKEISKIKVTGKITAITKTKIKTAQKPVLKVDVISRIAQKSIIKTRLALRTKQIQKKKTKKRIIVILPKKKRQQYRLLSKEVPIWKIQIKRFGKVRTLKKDLTLEDAKNLMAYHLDNTLMRTAKVIPMGKKSKRVLKLAKKYTGQFSKIKNKLRTYKLRKKKKIALGGIKYIERSKYISDRPGEKKELLRFKRRKSRLVKLIKKKKAAMKKTIRRKPIKKKKIVRRKKVVKRKPLKRKESLYPRRRS